MNYSIFMAIFNRNISSCGCVYLAHSLISVTQGTRDESPDVDEDEVEKDAEDLFKVNDLTGSSSNICLTYYQTSKF